MSRFSLRNKDKIINSFGQRYCDLLIDSLTDHFKDNKVIEEHTYEGVNFKIIHVPNIQPKTDSIFEFAITSKMFDVYNLAYYSAIS